MPVTTKQQFIMSSASNKHLVFTIVVCLTVRKAMKCKDTVIISSLISVQNVQNYRISLFYLVKNNKLTTITHFRKTRTYRYFRPLTSSAPVRVNKFPKNAEIRRNATKYSVNFPRATLSYYKAREMTCRKKLISRARDNYSRRSLYWYPLICPGVHLSGGSNPQSNPTQG